METIIYAKSLSENVINRLNISNMVHSTFDKGINIESRDGLIFIGGERMRVPFGIHMDLRDLKRLGNLQKGDKYRFNLGRRELILGGHTISLTRAKIYSSYIEKNLGELDKELLKEVFKKIVDLDFSTGFDLSLKEVIYKNDSPVINLRNNFTSHDEEEIEATLRSLIGRGRGLTPSGDDLILGLLLVNRLGPILKPLLIKIFKELIGNEILTTRVSMSYYNSGLKGEFSSPMIDLYKAILRGDRENMDSYINNIINYGHTSGRDTLTGIALGIERLINI